MAEQLRGMMPQPTIISAETSIRKGRCAHLCWQSSFARGANGMGAEADGVGLKFSLAKKLECDYLFFGLCRPLHADKKFNDASGAIDQDFEFRMLVLSILNAVWLKSNPINGLHFSVGTMPMAHDESCHASEWAGYGA